MGSKCQQDKETGRARASDQTSAGKRSEMVAKERPGIVERNRRAQKEKWALKAGK